MHAVCKKYELPRYVVSLHSVEKLQSFVNRLIWHVADCVAYLVWLLLASHPYMDLCRLYVLGAYGSYTRVVSRNDFALFPTVDNIQ